MAEATASMSGATNAAPTEVQDAAVAPAGNAKLERRLSSLPMTPSADPATTAAETGKPSGTGQAAAEAAEATHTAAPAATAAVPVTTAPASATTAAAPDAAGAPASSGGVLASPRPPPPAAVARGRSDSLAIKADNEIAPVATGSETGLVCNITLLLPTGNRHPFRIDDRYLAKRGVDVPDLTESGRRDPYSISVYKLKELILREWREDWEGKPASPSSIRLIHFGKLLNDKEQLRKYHFSTDAPNVVHMSVKPPEMMEDEEAAKGKASSREPRNREGGSGCCVIL